MQAMRTHIQNEASGHRAAARRAHAQAERAAAVQAFDGGSHGRTAPDLIQPKLTIGAPGDPYEQEADRVAETVVQRPAGDTPDLAPPPATRAAFHRPTGITPLMRQEAEPDMAEEAALETEEAPMQEAALLRRPLTAGSGRDGSGPSPIRTVSGLSSLVQRRGSPRPAIFTRAGRHPATRRGPPLQLMRFPGMGARSPPGSPQHSLTLQSPTGSVNRRGAPAHRVTARPAASAIQRRGPPPRVRTPAAEGRLEHDLRQSKGGGRPLPEKTRTRMEAGIGADFSGVRVHTDSRAADMSRTLHAQAFTHGPDIYFGQGRFTPDTPGGQFLLAHELTHTVQQGAAPPLNAPARPDTRAPPLQNRPAPRLQGGWLGDILNDYARYVPGWDLFTVIIGYNPLTESDVERTPRNFLKGFMGLVAGGAALYDKLEEGGLIDRAFTWLDHRISDLNLSWSRLRDALEDAWDDMDFIRLNPFDYNLRVLKRHLSPIWEDVKTFGGRVIDEMVRIARELLLTPLAEFIQARTRAYPLLTVILGEDPLTGEAVERTLYNIVSAFLLLTESGEEYLNKLNESGRLQELSDWLDAQIAILNVGPEVVTDAFRRAYDLLDLNAVLHPLDTLGKLYEIFSGPVTRLFNFVVTVAMKVLGLIKDWLLGLLKEYANRIPGYPLLTVILGRDPLTGEAMPRTPENFIRGFLSFVPGGRETFDNLKQSGAIDKAFAWLEKAVTKLGLIGEALMGAFIQLWESFRINDLTNPVAAFERVVAIFTKPVRMIIDFAVEVGLKVLEFIFEGVLGPTGARVLAILKQARTTFITIIRDPIAFVRHLIDAVILGFRQFSGNILDHLKAGLIGWLTGTLGGAGIQIPETFDLKGILSLVLQILGLTYDRIRPKLVRVLGERTVSFLESAFEVVRLLLTEGPGALWEKFLEYIDNLKETVIGGIRDWVITRIVTAAVTKIATMFNPAGAVIQAILSIYNTVMFFIERINQILDLVESVVASIARIAAGNIAEAANFVEQAMARTIPVIISFLARLIGLGNVAGAVQNIIRKIQGAVDRALDKVIDWIVQQARRLVSGGAAHGEAVDADAMPPEQRKAAAKTELEQWIQGGRRQGTAIKAKLPELKQKYRLSDVRLEFTAQGPRIGFYASAGEFTYFFDDQEYENTVSETEAGFKSVNTAASVPTPKGVISRTYGDLVRDDAFRCTAATLDRPVSVSAEQTGVGSSEGRGASTTQTNAGYVGIDEEKVMAGHRNTSYRGGHLIAYVILGDNSNRGFNLAPQVNRFNAPAYFKIFEEVAMNTPTTVEISVDVGYTRGSYTVDQQTLKENGILRETDPDRPWTVTLPKRIPKFWNATIIAKEGALVEGGVSRTTDTAQQGRVVDSEDEFNALVVDGSGNTEKVQKWNSFKMLITEGGQVNEDGSITSGGSTRLSVQAEQIDFDPPAVKPEPARAEASERVLGKMEADRVEGSVALLREETQRTIFAKEEESVKT